MSGGQLAGVVVLHKCGHRATRRVMSFNPDKKRYQTILNPEYLRHIAAPRAMQEKADRLVSQNLERCVQYWEDQDCPRCYRASLQPAVPWASRLGDAG